MQRNPRWHKVKNNAIHKARKCNKLARALCTNHMPSIHSPLFLFLYIYIIHTPIPIPIPIPIHTFNQISIVTRTISPIHPFYNIAAFSLPKQSPPSPIPMASSTLIPSAGICLSPDPPLPFSGQFSRHNSNSFVSLPNPRLRTSSIRASTATADYSSLTARQKVGVLTDNLDGWMRESVVEIVKSLKNSPLMVHVYCNGSTEEVKPEKTGSENWSELSREWRDGERRSPDGIILVQQLEDKIEYNNDADFEDADFTSTLTRKKSRETVSVKTEDEVDGTKAWGVLVQGKGRECSRTSCYLLKTCRVNSGLGLCGTHFSLVKVKNFRDSAFSQIKNSWLL